MLKAVATLAQCCTLGMCRFKASRAKEIIAAVLKARLTGAVYHADNTSSWAREIADDIKQKLKGTTVCPSLLDNSLFGPQMEADCPGPDPNLHTCPGVACAAPAEENWSRYKYAVQVFIGEQRGEGVRWGALSMLSSTSTPPWYAFASLLAASYIQLLRTSSQAKLPCGLTGWHAEASGMSRLTAMRMRPSRT
jgi:hypothetical protein